MPSLRFFALVKLLEKQLLAMTDWTLSETSVVISSNEALGIVEAGVFVGTNPSLWHMDLDTTKKASGTQSSTIGSGSVCSSDRGSKECQAFVFSLSLSYLGHP